MDAQAAKSRTKSPSYSRRFFWLAAFVVLLFGGYSGVWLYFAGQLEERAAAAITAMNTAGASAECADPRVRGYPFRIGLFCDRVEFADEAEGVRLQAGAFRSAGQIYDPTRLVAELDGPAAIVLPSAAPLALDWEGLRASVRLAAPLPERVSIETTSLTARLAAGTPLASFAAFEAHMRPNGRDIDLAASFEGLALGEAIVEGREVPALSGRSDLSITDGVSLIASGDDSMRGRSGLLRMLALSTGPDTGMAVSGPFSVGADGLIDADLRLTVRNPDGLRDVLSEAFPGARERIVTSFSGLSALGESPSVPLKIVRGRATLGFIPLGDVPPL